MGQGMGSRKEFCFVSIKKLALKHTIDFKIHNILKEIPEPKSMLQFVHL